MAKIAILGSGGFGCALAIMCANENHDVRLWSCFEEEIQTLKQEREHKKLLAGVKIPQSVQMTSDLFRASDCRFNHLGGSFFCCALHSGAA